MIYLLSLLDPTKEFASVCRNRRFYKRRDLLDYIKDYFKFHDYQTLNKKKKLALGSNAFQFIAQKDKFPNYKTTNKVVPPENYITIKIISDFEEEKAKKFMEEGKLLFQLESESNHEKLQRYLLSCPY